MVNEKGIDLRTKKVHTQYSTIICIIKQQYATMTKDAKTETENGKGKGKGRGGTSAWGPPLWDTIHFIALGYNGNHPEAYVSFYNSLSNTIPCKKCAAHYTQELEERPVEKYMDDLFEWTVLMHNSVNKKLGKKTWTVKKAREHYSARVFRPSSSVEENSKDDGGALDDPTMGFSDAGGSNHGVNNDDDGRESFEQNNATHDRMTKRRRNFAIILAVVMIVLIIASALAVWTSYFAKKTRR